MASVTLINTTIIAWQGVWECCDESRIDVRQKSRDVGDVQKLKSEGCRFSSPPTLLQECHPVASVTYIDTTIIAWQGVWKCCGERRMDVRQRSRGVEGVQ